MKSPRPLVLATVLAVGAIATVGVLTAPRAAASAASTTVTATVPHYDHIVVAFLENENAALTFENATNAPDLAKLRTQGAYVKDYWGVGHNSLDNYIALFGGEEPTKATKADCIGDAYPSCVFPASVPTLGSSLDKAGKSWKIYSEGMDGVPGVGGSCLHPVTETAGASVNLPDAYQGPGSNAYATRHNPAMWYASVTQKGADSNGDSAYCDAHSVDLTQLATDDRKASTLPTFSFVEPDTCHDGHDTHCVGDTASEIAAYADTPEITVLDQWVGDGKTSGFVKDLTSSAAWHEGNNLLVLTFDESLTGNGGDTSGCVACQDKTSPSGGGRIGALFIGTGVKKGYVSTWNGDHYGLLRTIEDSEGLPTLKSRAANAAAAATVHDGDAHVTPVTDIFTQNAVPTAPARTTTVTSGSTGSTVATTPSTATATTSSQGALAFTGLRTVVPLTALVLVGGGTAAGLVARRRRS